MPPSCTRHREPLGSGSASTSASKSYRRVRLRPMGHIWWVGYATAGQPRPGFTGSVPRSRSITSTVGVSARALAIRLNDDAAIGLPPRAALTVAGLSLAARARSTGLQPLLEISCRRRSGWTETLMPIASSTRSHVRQHWPPPLERSSSGLVRFLDGESYRRPRVAVAVSGYAGSELAHSHIADSSLPDRQLGISL